MLLFYYLLTGNFSQTPKKNLQRKSVSFGENENEQVKATDSKPATGSILKSNLKPQPTNNKSLNDFLDDFSDKDDPLDGLLSSESEANPVPASGFFGNKKNNQPEKSDEDSLPDFGAPKNQPKKVQPEKSVEPTPSKTNTSNQDFGATGLSFSDEDSLLDFGGPKNPPKKMQPPKKSESKLNEPAKSEPKRETISNNVLKDDGISGAAGLGLGFTDDESDLTLTDPPVKEKPKRAVSPVQEENNDDWLNDLLGKPVVNSKETKPDRNTKLIQESLDFSGKSIEFSDDDTEQFLIQKKKEKVSAKKEEPIIKENINEESVPENIHRPIHKEKTPPFEIPPKRISFEKPKENDFIPVKDVPNQSMNLQIEKLRLENENLRISQNSNPRRQSNDDSINGEIQKLRHRIEIMTSGKEIM